MSNLVSCVIKPSLLAVVLGSMVLTRVAGAVEPLPVPVPAVPVKSESHGRLLVQAVYQVLLGEIALRRGDGDVAFAAWRDLAVKSEEPYALRRAIEIAVNAQRFDLALPLSARWQELEPDVAEAHYTYGLTAERAGKLSDALIAADKARQLRPTWAQPWILAAQIRAANKDMAGAVELMREFVQKHAGTEKEHPGNLESRQYLARLLVNSGQFLEARSLFRALSQEWPDSPDLHYPVAILSLQMNDIPAAKVELESLLKLPLAEPNTAHYFLGQIAEQERDHRTALTHFEAVRKGEYWLSARLRSIRLLKELRQEPQALDELEHLLKAMPDNAELLYETALLAEKSGHLDRMERHLRYLLKLQPENALALNALGYSLADHRTKLPEAQVLVSKALSLNPDDPFIMDSMGWVLFRLGNLEGAHDYLSKAYQQKDDPEIAAHLGEVLWSLNRKDEARNVWQSALLKTPNNDQLRNTIERFLPQGLSVSESDKSSDLR
jgi:tetratricopeptide (TPR) repeat protein